MALTLVEIVKDQNGYESESQVIAYDIPRRKLIKAVDKGNLFGLDMVFMLFQRYERIHTSSLNIGSRVVYSPTIQHCSFMK